MHPSMKHRIVAPRPSTWLPTRRALTVIAVLLVAPLAAACGSSSTSATNASNPKIVVSYWQQPTPLPETILATQKSLQAKVPATVDFLSIDSGPAALAALSSGALSIVGGVGNPPVVAAIAKHTNMKIVWAQYYDFAGLTVRNSLKTPQQMAGHTFGTQIGSSEDFSFRGWLQSNGLEGKVTLVDMQPNAMLAAYKTGAIDGGWVSEPYPHLMASADGHIVTTSADMVQTGSPGVNGIAVNGTLIKQHPDVVQAYVCAISQAAAMIKGPDATQVLNTAGEYAGGKPNTPEVVQLGAQWPYWPLGDEIGPKGLGSTSDPGSGLYASVLIKTGKFLEQSGKIPAAPSAQDIAAVIDPTFADKAVNGGCK